MGNEDVRQAVSVEKEGVTVEKRFVKNEFRNPALKFHIESGRDSEISLHVTDKLPDGFEKRNVGFHPDYEEEHWTAHSDGRVEYTRTVEPHETIETLYALRIGRRADPKPFLNEPYVQVRDVAERHERAK